MVNMYAQCLSLKKYKMYSTLVMYESQINLSSRRHFQVEPSSTFATMQCSVIQQGAVEANH